MKRCPRCWKAVLAIAIICMMTTQVFAGSMEDAQKDKEDAENNKTKAEQILSELENVKSDLESYIQGLDTQLAQIQTEINQLNEQKTQLEADIVIKQQELEQARIIEQQQYLDMCARIQFMYENGEEDYAGALLQAESMSDMLNEPEYASAMAEYDYNMLERLVQIREQIANDEQILQSNLSEVEQLTAQVQEEEAAVETLKDAKSAEVAKYQQDIDEYERLVAQYDAEIQAAADRIAEIEAAAAAAAAQGDTTTNAGNTYIPYEGGALIWPCPSSYQINSGFGKREASGVVTANHYGIDIGCPDGTPIVAAASGVVVLARYSNSAGNWIIISHGNGLYTIYMHASVLYVSEGQYVNGGDTIMLSGATGATQGRHLHFEVRVGGYQSSKFSVDPMNYY